MRNKLRRRKEKLNLHPASYLGLLLAIFVLGALYSFQNKTDKDILGEEEYARIYPEARYTKYPRNFPRLPAFNFNDVNGKPIPSSSLKDKWTFLFFGYSHCPDICYPTLQKLSILKANNPSTIEIVFVSIDEERDDIEQLKQFVSNFPEKINVLAGGTADGTVLVKHFAIAKQKDSSLGTTLYNHTTGIVLLDKEIRAKAYLPSEIKYNDLAKIFENIKTPQ